MVVVMFAFYVVGAFVMSKTRCCSVVSACRAEGWGVSNGRVSVWFIFGMLTNYQTIKGVEPSYQQALLGGLLVAAVVADRLLRGSRHHPPAGEAHHCCMLHSSGANHSCRPRSSLIFEYRATDARQIAGATDPVGWGTQLRGSHRDWSGWRPTAFISPAKCTG
ncbi:MAG TPA: hypothetical protein VL984_16035 [Acidimicrobiales bacterium]|nr:hypothetical protein [Acidimicrobiales bacterium]